MALGTLSCIENEACASPNGKPINPNTTPMTLKKGAEVECFVESLAYKGKGVAKLDGFTLFIPNTAPGDTVRARVVKKKKRYGEGKLLEVVTPSPLRIDPTCRHAPVCGGCTLQHLPYEEQKKAKEQQVRDHMTRFAHLDDSVVLPILGCETPLYYRNKMEYSFGTRRWLTQQEIESDAFVDDHGFVAGLHAPGRYDKILPLQECHLQPPLSYQILDMVREWCIRNDVAAYDPHTREGFMRHLMIRNSVHTNEWMVNLVTFRDDIKIVVPLAMRLSQRFPEITTIVNNINDTQSPTSVGRYERVLLGDGSITDKIGGLSFQIDANAFFQTNTRQAETLYKTALELAAPSGDETMFDLYCGVGTITLFFSPYVSKAVGIELSAVAVENAAANAKENGISNTEFVLGDMKDTFNDELLAKHGRPDLLITDPPRAGMHPDVVQKLNELRVPSMVYVSCNPSTMARDLELLGAVYETECVRPVDMFPQTYHIEAVAKLRLRG